MWDILMLVCTFKKFFMLPEISLLAVASEVGLTLSLKNSKGVMADLGAMLVIGL